MYEYKGYIIYQLLNNRWRITKDGKSDWYEYETLADCKIAINHGDVALEETGEIIC